MPNSAKIDFLNAASFAAAWRCLWCLVQHALTSISVHVAVVEFNTTA